MVFRGKSCHLTPAAEGFFYIGAAPRLHSANQGSMHLHIRGRNYINPQISSSTMCLPQDIFFSSHQVQLAFFDRNLAIEEKPT